MTDRSSNIAAGNSTEIPRQLRGILDLLGLTDETLSNAGMPEKVLHHLYRVLDTLDSKTSHVLRFISLILAAQVFLASTMIHAPNAPKWARILLLLCPLLSLVGGMYALDVFRVKWPFLGWQEEKKVLEGRPAVEAAMKQEFRKLAQLCDTRYRTHSRVMCLAQLSASVLGSSVLGVVVWMLLR